MRLFLERGFDPTTMDDIAKAANVSRRTLFHYFASKDEIVFSTKADFPVLIVEAIQRRPANEPLLDMVENAFFDLAARNPSTRARDLARLIHDTPALSVRDHATYEKVERVLAAALADRKGLPAADIACRVTAAVAIGILKLSMEAWLASEDEGPEIFGHIAFAALREILGRKIFRSSGSA